jgi:predicted transposase YdaD
VKTDSIFYRLFQKFPSIFFELIGSSPETASSYQFSSVEIKQTAFRDVAITSAKELINRTKQAVNLQLSQVSLLELIETILVYKFPRMSREEIEAMFGLSDLKQTRVYQEGRLEAKLESVPRLLALGLTVEQIAQALDLDVAQVQQALQQLPPK